MTESSLNSMGTTLGELNTFFRPFRSDFGYYIKALIFDIVLDDLNASTKLIRKYCLTYVIYIAPILISSIHNVRRQRRYENLILSISIHDIYRHWWVLNSDLLLLLKTKRRLRDIKVLVALTLRRPGMDSSWNSARKWATLTASYLTHSNTL